MFKSVIFKFQSDSINTMKARKSPQKSFPLNSNLILLILSQELTVNLSDDTLNSNLILLIQTDIAMIIVY